MNRITDRVRRLRYHFGCLDQHKSALEGRIVTIRALLILASVIFGYFSSTWMLFGAVHPCEILLTRQKDHAIQVAQKHHIEELEAMKELAGKTFPKENYGQVVQILDEYSNASWRLEEQKQSVLSSLRQEIRKLTTAQCAWQAATSHFSED